MKPSTIAIAFVTAAIAIAPGAASATTKIKAINCPGRIGDPETYDWQPKYVDQVSARGPIGCKSARRKAYSFLRYENDSSGFFRDPFPQTGKQPVKWVWMTMYFGSNFAVKRSCRHGWQTEYNSFSNGHIRINFMAHFNFCW